MKPDLATSLRLAATVLVLTLAGAPPARALDVPSAAAPAAVDDGVLQFGERRLVLPPGHYAIRYDGEVDSSPHLADPAAVTEVPIATLPFEALPYLYASRYCQSDLLGRFARTFHLAA